MATRGIGVAVIGAPVGVGEATRLEALGRGYAAWGVGELQAPGWRPSALDDVAGLTRALEGALGAVIVARAEEGISAGVSMAQAVHRLRCALDACLEAGIKRVSCVLGVEVLGPGAWSDEEARAGAGAPGAAGVAVALEGELYRAMVGRGLEVIPVIPTHVVGAGVRAGRVWELAQGGLMSRLRAPERWDLIGAHDAAWLALTAMERGRPGRRYVASAQVVERAQLEAWLGLVSGLPGQALRRLGVGDVMGWSAQPPQRAARELGFAPSQPVEEALRAMRAARVGASNKGNFISRLDRTRRV